MQINNVMGVTVGPGGYFLNFTQYGLQINQGHEVMMDRCWLGETNFDFDHERLGRPPNATAVQINGNDHYILNTIVFSSKVGLEVNGAADYISGVHVWFPVNHAVHYADTMAFHITRGGNRFSGCYIDGGRAVFDGRDALTRNLWERGFECCQRGDAAPGTTPSGILLVGDKVGPGLQIINNIFGGGSIYHRHDLWPPASRRTGTVEDAESDADCPARLNTSSADRECQGLHTVAASSLEACAAACCTDPKCSVYQWCPKGGTCQGATGTDAQCWTGPVSGCTGGTRKGWAGMSSAPVVEGVRIAHNSMGWSSVSGASMLPAPVPVPVPVAAVEGVRIAHNSMGGKEVGTQATLSLTQAKPTSTWKFDFCDRLIFPQIAIVRVHVVAVSGFPIAVARPPDGCEVTVETNEPVTGTITVDVDSSAPSEAF